ncbi:MAG TPA: hypothetical protein VJT49_21745 [Amycolatopsis sp.]|uniref:hypothetical protein n=1 Tax=Amycolatopsis sp. TaxID=37632 RepID=UPI002B47FB9E|nr:hypothetical protein [Amycolatopsis sp.]HKS47684.1 hypothetical protein [Amycolatopsis sp.]
MPAIPRQPPPVGRSRSAGIRRPSPTPRPKRDEAPEVDAAPDEVVDQSFERPKPSPRPKSRDEGTAKPVDYEAAEAAVAVPEPVPAPASRPPRNKVALAGVLFVLALVLTTLAVWFKIEESKLAAATSNTALLDVARTSQVNQAATSAVETLFSYDYNSIAKTQDAAGDLLLNDDVRNKYNSLMGEVERLAPQQKIVVTVKVSRSAVIMLNGDKAKVMVFVDQTATRTDQNQTSSGSAQLWLNLQYSGDKWRITDLNTYDTEQPAPSSAASSAPSAGNGSSAPPPSR